MRAALLPAGPDPFLIAYWLRHYRTWAAEVDELRLMVCGQRNQEVRDYIRACVAAVPHASVEFLDARTDHGKVMGMLFANCDADLVLFCEDDAFVRQPGAIDNRFKRIEAGLTDVVGCPRGNASMRLVAAAEAIWGKPPDTVTGETGLALFPAFVFARRSDLERTDGNFSARNWRAGIYLPQLNLYTEEDDSADTFTDTSWQLRALGLRIEAEPAYRSASKGGDAPWFHVGSLSAGYGNAFMVDMTPERRAAYWDQVRVPGEKWDWMKRASWWERVWECWDGGIPDHHREYGESLRDFELGVAMEPATVAYWRDYFDHSVTWPEL